MAGVSVKISADVGDFKKNIGEATGAVKTLDAQLETNEKQLKLNGDAELYMSNKVGLLKAQLEQQQKVVSNTAKALQQMKDQGVDPSSKAYQTMETNLAKAAGKLIDIKTDLKNAETGAKGAADGTKGMNTELKNIGKGVSFHNIADGLSKITKSLESAGRAAVNFGKKIVKSAMDSTGWADDVMTRSLQYGDEYDAEMVQKMDNVAAYIDTDVDTIIAARSRLAKNSGKLSELFGIETDGMSLEDQFWAAGEALKAMTDDVEQEQAAQEIFGRSWRELLPLFEAGRDKYEQMLDEQNVLSNEQVEKLAQADDQFKQLEQEVQRLKNEFWANNSETITKLLQWILDNKDAVVGALAAIGTAFGAIKIAEFASSLKEVVAGFKELWSHGDSPTLPNIPTTGAAGSAAKTAAEAAAGATATSAAAGAAGGAGTVGTVAGWGMAGVSGTSVVMGGALIAAIALMIEEQNDREGRWARKYAEREGVLNQANAAGLDSSKVGLYADIIRAANPLMNREGNYSAEAEQLRILSYLGDVYNRGSLYTDIMSFGAVDEMGNRATSSGNFIWSELMRYWNGEAMDSQRIDAMVEYIADTYSTKLQQMAEGGNAPELPMEPVLEDDAGAQIQAQLAAMGSFGISVTPIVSGLNGIFSLPGHANGLPFVPYDGYLSVLHRGERVMTASENRHYTYNSNNYFGNVNLNNGQDIEALTDAIDRRNRRQRSGYGA